MIYYFFLLYVAATILPMAKSNNFRHKGRLLNIKDGVGFEPTEPIQVQQFSSPTNLQLTYCFKTLF